MEHPGGCGDCELCQVEDCPDDTCADLGGLGGLGGLRSDDVLAFPFSFGPFMGFWAAFDGAVRLGNPIELVPQPCRDLLRGRLWQRPMAGHLSTPCISLVGDVPFGGRPSASSAARRAAMARWNRERTVPGGISSTCATDSSGMSK